MIFKITSEEIPEVVYWPKSRNLVIHFNDGDNKEALCLCPICKGDCFEKVNKQYICEFCLDPIDFGPEIEVISPQAYLEKMGTKQPIRKFMVKW